MYNLVVNVYYEKDITRFGLNRAKIGKNHNIPIFCNLHYNTYFFDDVMVLIFVNGIVLINSIYKYHQSFAIIYLFKTKGKTSRFLPNFIRGRDRLFTSYDY